MMEEKKRRKWKRVFWGEKDGGGERKGKREKREKGEYAAWKIVANCKEEPGN